MHICSIEAQERVYEECISIHGLRNLLFYSSTRLYFLSCVVSPMISLFFFSFVPRHLCKMSLKT